MTNKRFENKKNGSMELHTQWFTLLLFLLGASTTGAGVDYYSILNVSTGSTPCEIRASFSRLARGTHTSLLSSSFTGRAEALTLISAYEVLRNLSSRAIYERDGATPADRLRAVIREEAYYSHFAEFDVGCTITTMEPTEVWQRSEGESFAIILYYPGYDIEYTRIWREVHAKFGEVVDLGMVNCIENEEFCRAMGRQELSMSPLVIQFGHDVRSACFDTAEIEQSSCLKSFDEVRNFLLEPFPVPYLIRSRTDLYEHLESNDRPWVLLVCTDHEAHARNAVSPHRSSIACASEAYLRLAAAHFSRWVRLMILNCAENQELCGNLTINTQGYFSGSNLDDMLCFFELSTEEVALTQVINEYTRAYPPQRSLTPADLEGEVLLKLVGKSTALVVFVGGSVDDVNVLAKMSLQRESPTYVINCSQWDDECASMGVRLPEARLYRSFGFDVYHGASPLAKSLIVRDVVNFAALSELSRTVALVSTRELDSVANADKHWLIAFYDSRSFVESQVFLPRFRALSKLHETGHAHQRSIHFGIIDCSRKLAKCDKRGRNGPAIAFIEYEKAPIWYGGALVGNFSLHAFLDGLANPQMNELTSANWDKKVMRTQSLWLVIFTVSSADCEICATLTSYFSEISRNLEGVAQRGIVYCDVTDLCDQLKLTVPTVRLYAPTLRKNSKSTKFGRDFEDFSGVLDLWSVLDWVSERLPAAKLIQLTAASHTKRVVEGKGTWVIAYTTSSWCRPCARYKATQQRIAHLLRHEAVRVCFIDCDRYRETCSSNGITEYPTVILQTAKSATRVPTLDMSETVAWVRSRLPQVKADPKIVKTLRIFYDKFDPGKMTEELHAIANRFTGNENKLFESLSEKYGIHPEAVLDPNEELDLTGTYSAALYILSTILIVIFLFTIEGSCRSKVMFSGTTNKAMLLVGSAGTVGSGIMTAFKLEGWTCFGIDPKINCFKDDVSMNDMVCSVESLSNTWLREKLLQCSFVIYAAESGERDDYRIQDRLGKANDKRFQAFVERCRALLGPKSQIRLIYVGGSWIKRKSVCGVVSDESPNDTDSTEPYVLSKIAAEKNARQASMDYSVSIHFFDWASVVPNYSRNHPCAKMIAEAIAWRRVTHSPPNFGRPLLHSTDAGRYLVAYCKHELTSQRPSSVPVFQQVLVPGQFVPFKYFAEVAKATVSQLELEDQGDADGLETMLDTTKPISFVEQSQTPAKFSVSCESKLSSLLEFELSDALIRAGLRDSCVVAWNSR